MNNLFYYCQSLTNVDISKWDTSNVKTMENMFNAPRLSSVDVSGFDTSQVTNMNAMFSGLSNLTTLDVSNFDTSQVTNMSAMFSGLSNLKTLDVSNFDTSQVTDMMGMFSGTSSIKYLDLAKWDMGKVTRDYSIFNSMSSLEKIRLGINVKFVGKQYLPEIKATDEFTGFWINIGTGSAERPNGSNIFTSENLTGMYEGATMADTYVWQKWVPVSINVHDSTIYVGDKWNAEDNFDSALDKDENKVDFSQLTVDDSKVDTSKAGVYDVTYTYDGVSSVAKVTIKNKMDKGNEFSNENDDQKLSINKSNKNELPETGAEKVPIGITLFGVLSIILSLGIFLGRYKIKNKR